MDQLAVGLLMLASLGLAWIVWHFDSRRNWVITPFVLFTLWEARLNWLPALEAPLSGASSDHYTASLLVVSFWVFLLAFVLGSNLLRLRAQRVTAFRAKGVTVKSERAHAVVLVGFGVFLILAGLYLYRGIPPLGVALAGLFGGQEEAAIAGYLGQARKAVTKGHVFGGAYRGQGILRTLMFTGWSYFVMMAFSLFRGTGRKVWLWTGILAVIPSLLFIGGDGTRGPLGAFLVLLMVFMSLTVRVRLKALLAGVVVVFAVLIGATVLGPKDRAATSGTEVVQQVATRAFRGNGINTVRMVEKVRDGTWSLRHGAVHARDFRAALPGAGAGKPLAHELYLALNPGATGTTYQTATYAADLYVDFGPIGMVFGYGVLGLLVAGMQHWLFGLRKTPVSLPFVALMSYNVGILPAGGPVSLAAVTFVILGITVGVGAVVVALRTTLRPRSPGWTMMSGLSE